MKILFLESHPMWIYGLPNGFRDAGHQVLVSGPLTKENLQSMLRNFCPDLIFSIGWGPENSSLEKQQWIKNYVKSSKIPHVYWATEDPTHTKAFTIPYLKRVQPDFVFTICRNNVEYYQSLGINAEHLDFGFHSSVHKPTKSYDNYKGKIAVVANAYPHKLKIYTKHYRHESLNVLIKPLLDANIRVDFYGKHWDNMKQFLGTEIQKDWLHDYVPYTDANKVYSSNDIIIGIQNNLTQLNQRIYEILGSGGFLITNDTPEINRLFNVGKDLIVSSSPEETLQLVQYYLRHPEERNVIKANGSIAVETHSYKHRAEYIIDVLNKQGLFCGRSSNYKLNLMENTSFIHERWELYTVCNGDTLSSISRNFGVPIKKLMEINELTSDMIDHIDAGQLLKIRRLATTEKKQSSVLICKGNTNKKYIALTYDAGDGASATSHLLNVLDKYNVKTTFFLTGEWTEKYPDIGRQIINSGHEIGNHTFNHPDLTKITRSEIIDEVVKAEATIKKLTNTDCRPLFRPPFGAWNRDVLEALGELGYQYSIYWSLDTIDWKQPSVDDIVTRIMDRIKNDDIILMHLEYLNTAKATDIIIPKLKALGYEFVKVSQMLTYNDNK